MRDIKNNLAIVHLLDPKDVVTADTVSPILDTWGFNGALIEVIVGAITGVDASNYLTPVFQESATIVGADFTTAAAGSLHGAFTKIDAATKDQVTQVVGYAGSKRYIRVNLDFTGTLITAALVSVIGVLGRPRVSPAVAPAAITAT